MFACRCFPPAGISAEGIATPAATELGGSSHSIGGSGMECSARLNGLDGSDNFLNREMPIPANLDFQGSASFRGQCAHLGSFVPRTS